MRATPFPYESMLDPTKEDREGGYRSFIRPQAGPWGASWGSSLFSLPLLFLSKAILLELSFSRFLVFQSMVAWSGYKGWRLCLDSGVRYGFFVT